MGYDPKVDLSPEIEPDAVSYQAIINILKWTTELWRIDKIFKVLLLLSHLVLPREGYYDAAVHVMPYKEVWLVRVLLGYKGGHGC